MEIFELLFVVTAGVCIVTVGVCLGEILADRILTEMDKG